MSLLKLIGGRDFLLLNKVLIKKIGLLEAITVGELISLQTQYGDGFFMSREIICESIGLSKFQLDKAVKTLIDKNILTVETKGLPRRNYYSVSESVLVGFFTDKQLESDNQQQNNLTLSSEDIKPPVVKKLDCQQSSNLTSSNKKENKKKEKENYLVEKEPKEPRTPAKEINDTFNEICGEVGLTKWTTLSDKRRTEIRKLWKQAKELEPEFTLAHWFHLCVMIAEEPQYEWTRGGLADNGVTYKPRDISFLLKNDHLLKAIEFRDQRTNGEYLPTPQEIETAKNKESRNA